ncbi:acyl carrier protein [Rhodococcus erythropolis]|uniref:Acyl carrier protein n=1 Tax=Rhodococcus erythropolis TaxID=1833 RepID=A0AAX4A0C0_RHOER|nr:acyl carrier protein [Rhodococcus erythropolis]WMN03103.1 acyl carrier protein [Rhodococcus erythropolis]
MNSDTSGACSGSRSANPPGEQEIRSWLVETMAGMSAVPRAEIDTTVPFAELSLTSLQGVRMSADLGEWLGMRIPNGVVFDYPTIDLMARYLSNAVKPVEEVPAAVDEEPDPHDPDFDESMEELLRLLDEDVRRSAVDVNGSDVVEDNGEPA